MNRLMILSRYTMAALAVAALAACGGGGGGGAAAGGGGGGGAFTATALQPVAGSTFSVAAAVNASDEAVGMSDGDPTAPQIFKAVAWTVTAAGGPATSVVTPLAMPPGAGAYSAAYGNNSSGAIVGEIESTSGGAVAAAFWPSRTAAPAQVVLLPHGAATRSAAYSINATGRIVGELDNGTASTAVTWANPNAGPVNLPMAAGQIDATAFFINDAGEIAGELLAAGKISAALWRPNATGAYVDAPLLLPGAALLDGDSTALSINAAGVIAGEITDIAGKVHAARWSPGPGGVYTLADLGTAGDAGSSASAINDAGQTVGHAVAAGGTATAVAWAPGATASAVVDAAPAGSQAYAINAGNRVVGMSGTQAFIALPQ